MEKCNCSYTKVYGGRAIGIGDSHIKRDKPDMTDLTDHLTFDLSQNKDNFDYAIICDENGDQIATINRRDIPDYKDVLDAVAGLDEFTF